jgi:chemotaxis signal transduction protein
MATTSTSTTGSQKHGAPAERGVCTFWLGRQHFGLDVAFVSEVVIVGEVTTVPRSPAAVRGIFNLRGTAVPLVDLREVLDHESGPPTSQATTTTALVIRHDDLLVAFPIDRMESVVLSGQGRFTSSANREHAAVCGFLELDGAFGNGDDPIREQGRTVTLLEPSVLLSKLAAVRFVAPDA